MPEWRKVMIVSPASATNLTSTRASSEAEPRRAFGGLPPEREHEAFIGHELDELALHDPAALRVDPTDAARPRIELGRGATMRTCARGRSR